jgi:hypothetical protein
LSQTIHKQIPRHLWFAQVCSGNNGQQACFAGHSAKAGSFQCKGLLLTPKRPKKQWIYHCFTRGGKIGYVDGGDISSTNQFVDWKSTLPWMRIPIGTCSSDSFKNINPFGRIW